MRTKALTPTRLITLALGLVSLGLGLWLGSLWLFGGAAAALGFVSARVGWLASPMPAVPAIEAPAADARAPRPTASRPPVDASDTDALVDHMLAQGRSALLLRPQIAASLDVPLFGRTLQAFSAAMALVPEGEVTLFDGDDTEAPGRVARAEVFFLDRYPVTNRQFFEFTEAGGYEEMALWDSRIWPAVLDFVDRTGQPGPRYWRRGCYNPGEDELPVVGVSWYEAAACARWLGKRLPSDAEWVKAAAWPVALSAVSRSQRRFPWGESLDRTKANVWGSGPGRAVSVYEFAEGVSVGGVYQMIGNVWEWTAAPFNTHRAGGELALPVPMRAIRGGAFDTYFDNQASCQFQSGENPLARRYNIGFRCAIGACDLSLAKSPAASAGEAMSESVDVEEPLVEVSS